MITKSLINSVKLPAGTGAVLRVIWDATDLDFKKLKKKILRLYKVLKGEKKILMPFRSYKNAACAIHV